MPAMSSVQLKAGLRPITSEAMPQKEAPMQRPTKVAHVVYRTCVDDGPNSSVNWGKVSATP